MHVLKSRGIRGLIVHRRVFVVRVNHNAGDLPTTFGFRIAGFVRAIADIGTFTLTSARVLVANSLSFNVEKLPDSSLESEDTLPEHLPLSFRP